MAQFYFINKDEKSSHLSRSKPSEQAAIQRYVQTGRKRPRPSKKAALPTRHRPEEVTCPRSATSQQWWCEEASAVGPIANCLSNQDPFDASVVKLDAVISGLLHYYVYYYHPVLWPNEMAVLRNGMYTFHEAVKAILQTVVANEMMMYCLLSAASCRMRYIDHLPSGAVTEKEEHYIANALRLMSRRVSSTDLKQVLICIMFMLSTDSYRHELAAAKLHLQAAYRLLEPLGGITAVEDEALQGQLAMGDLFLACCNIEPCLFDCSYNPGPASILNLSSAELMNYQPLAQAFPARGRLKQHITDLAEAYSIRNRLRIPDMPASRAMQATRWITKRCMAIRHDLLGMRLEGADHALRIVLIMWSLLSMNVTGRSKTVKVMAPGLRKALIKVQSWPDTDLREWILLVGFQCAQENSSTAQWFVSQLLDVYSSRLPQPSVKRRLSEQQVDLMQTMIISQRRYFYDEVVQRSRTYALAGQLLALRAIRG